MGWLCHAKLIQRILPVNGRNSRQGIRKLSFCVARLRRNILNSCRVPAAQRLMRRSLGESCCNALALRDTVLVLKDFEKGLVVLYDHVKGCYHCSSTTHSTPKSQGQRACFKPLSLRQPEDPITLLRLLHVPADTDGLHHAGPWQNEDPRPSSLHACSPVRALVKSWCCIGGGESPTPEPVLESCRWRLRRLFVDGMGEDLWLATVPKWVTTTTTMSKETKSNKLQVGTCFFEGWHHLPGCWCVSSKFSGFFFS